MNNYPDRTAAAAAVLTSGTKDKVHSIYVE
jgi:hypothetical protein